MSKLIKKHVISNFGGGVKSDVASVYLGDGFVPDSYNVDFSLVPGAARKRKGYTRVNATIFNTTAGGAVTGMYQTKLNGNWVQLVACADEVYSWNQSTNVFTQIVNGLASDKNYLVDFCTTYTTTNGFVIFYTNGQDQIFKYDGTTNAAISITEGYNYFKCNYLAHFKGYCIFANTWEGSNLANAWTNTSGTIYSHNSESVVLEVAEVWNTTSELTRTSGTQTAPGSGEYGVSSKILYVNIGGAPGTNIHITYKCKERVRWSDANNAEGYTAANYNDVVSGAAGKEIMRIMPLRDLLIIYKEDSIWAMYYTGDATAPFGFYCIDHNTPCIAGYTVADVKGEHFFLSTDGIMKTDGAKIEPVLVSKNVPEWFKYLSASGCRYSYAATNTYLHQYRLIFPITSSTSTTNNNREVRYDYENDIWSIHGYSGNANIIGVMQDNGRSVTWDELTSTTWDEITSTWDNTTTVISFPTFYTGDYTGYLRQHDQVEYDQESSNNAISAWFKTKPIPLSDDENDLSKYKKLLKCRVLLDKFTDSFMYVDYSINGGRTFTVAAYLDLDELGDDQFVASADLAGNCKELIYRIRGSIAASTPFCLYWLQTDYLVRSDL